MSAPIGPLRPHVRLRVGVVGHRPHSPGDKLPDAAIGPIALTIGKLLETLSTELPAAMGEARWAFGADGPELVVVSSLAEGADRMVAEAGLAVGASLEVVLPTPRAIYEQEFETPESRIEYQTLLAQAQSVFELDRPGGPLSQKRGYEAAALVMLAHTDILIAVWDEGEAAGIGGTANTVAQAVAEGAPVLLINPKAPDKVWLLWTGDVDVPPGHMRMEDLPRREAAPLLPMVLRSLVAPPPEEDAQAALRAFYVEPIQASRGVPVYSLFLWGLSVRPLQSTDFKEPPLDDDEPLKWRVRFPGRSPPDPLSEAVCSRLLPNVAIVDRLAVRYGEIYRSAFVYNFLAAAVAVALALAGLFVELPWFENKASIWDLAHIGNDTAAIEIWRLSAKLLFVAMEFGVLLSILGVWRRGASRAWHRRWLDYRRAAEWLRHLRILTLVGARNPIARPRRMPHGHSEAKKGVRLEQDDWVSWYVRSIERLLPMPNRVTDPPYLAEVRGAVIGAELNGQIKYHHDNCHRMELVSDRLHHRGKYLFIGPMALGGVFAGLFFIQAFTGWRIAENLRFVITALAAGLPAFGAALNAVRVQGDFETVSERSDAAAARLAAVRAALENEPLDFPRLADRTQRTAEVMGADLAEWQTLFRTRPLNLPA